ncbi:hypothetical protein RIR_jg20123.t1 [Rhizophagus irregularis DAOM 181602=DAOM 197198]|nr:hypothetical protein RIR_jg20123.t1 [Rhizophagus irregularis DAOM 181602=DAOM 197198]
MVLLDYFESDILTFLSDFLATVGSFLFRFFQISFTCGISTSFFQVLEHGFWQVKKYYSFFHINEYYLKLFYFSFLGLDIRLGLLQVILSLFGCEILASGFEPF